MQPVVCCAVRVSPPMSASTRLTPANTALWAPTALEHLLPFFVPQEALPLRPLAPRLLVLHCVQRESTLKKVLQLVSRVL